MIDGLKKLIGKINNDTVIIPASGAPCRSDQLGKQLQLCEGLIAKVAKNYYSGLTCQDFLDSQPLLGLPSFDNGAELFLHTAYEGAWWHLRELRPWAKRS